MKKIIHIPEGKAGIFGRYYRFFFYLICFSLLVTAVVKFGGALNKTEIGVRSLKVRLDHFLHALAYFLFSFYFIAGRCMGLCLFRKHEMLYFFLVLFITGFFAEVIQIWVPYRSFSLLDLLSNLTGIALGYLLTGLILKFIPSP